MEESVFKQESIPKAYFTLSVPVVFSMVISIVYNITDTYFIAMTRNTELVAGISLCAPVFMLLMGLGNIFGQGGCSLISRLLGKNDRENMLRVSSFCFYAMILLGVVAGFFMLIFRVPILQLLGADQDTLQYALPYFSWFAAGAPAVTLSFIHSNLLRSEGLAKESMIASVSGSVANMILDPALIFGLRLGAAGAAIATVIGYLCTDLYALWVVRRKSRILSVDPRLWRIDREQISQIFGIGISAALSNITSSVCLILTNHCLLPFGNDKIAAMGIVQKVSTVVMLAIVGFSFGGAPLIGYTFGAGDTDRLRQLRRFVLRFLCSLSLLLSVLMAAFAPAVVRMFMSDTALVETGSLMLRTQLLGMVFVAVVLFFTVYFQATGKAAPALALALSRQGLIFAAVLLIAVRIAGYNGILLTQCIADLLSAALALCLYRCCRRPGSAAAKVL